MIVRKRERPSSAPTGRLFYGLRFAILLLCLVGPSDDVVALLLVGGKLHLVYLHRGEQRCAE